MKTITKTFTLYSFDELSEEAKEKVIENYRENQNFDYIWHEAEHTLNKFCEIFSIKWSNFDPEEMHRSQWSHNLEENILELSGQRLATYIWNNYRGEIFKGKYYGKLVDTFPNGDKIPVSKEYPIGQRHVKRYSKCIMSNDCVLTGVCYDMDILGPIYEFLDNPKNINFETLLNDCLYSFGHSIASEIRCAQSDIAIIEEITENGYEYTEEGEQI